MTFWRRSSGPDDYPPGTHVRFDLSASSVTFECFRRAHDECRHHLRFTGAPDVRVDLCACRGCHVSCPVQGSPTYLEFAQSCACPGHVQARRRTEQSGLDLARADQAIAAALPRLFAEPEPERHKKSLVKLYQAAAAQAAGQPSPHEDVEFDGAPRQAMDFAVGFLAARFSLAEAARLLGLTEAQVSSAIQIHGSSGRWRRQHRGDEQQAPGT